MPLRKWEFPQVSASSGQLITRFIKGWHTRSADFSLGVGCLYLTTSNPFWKPRFLIVLNKSEWDMWRWLNEDYWLFEKYQRKLRHIKTSANAGNVFKGSQWKIWSSEFGEKGEFWLGKHSCTHMQQWHVRELTSNHRGNSTVKLSHRVDPSLFTMGRMLYEIVLIVNK